MPLSVPDFRIAPMSLGSSPPRGQDIFGSLLSTIIGNSLALKNAKEMEDIRFGHEKEVATRNAQATEAANFASSIESGKIEPRSSITGLAEDAINRLTPMPAPQGTAEPYYRTADVQAAQPLAPMYPGRDFLPGATVGQVKENGQISQQLLDEETYGNRQKMYDMLQPIIKRGGESGKLAQSLYDSISADKTYTLAEEKRDLGTMHTNLSDYENYDHLHQQIAQLSQARLDAYHKRIIEIGNKFEVQDPSVPGGLRRMNPLEAQIAAGMEYPDLAKNMNEANTKRGLGLWGMSGGTGGPMIPKTTPADFEKDAERYFVASADPSSPTYNSFNLWVMGHLHKADGSVNKDIPLYKRIMDAENAVTDVTIGQYTRQGGLTADLRAAFAAQNSFGIYRLTDLNKKLHGGAALPFTKQAVINGQRAIGNDSFFDIGTETPGPSDRAVPTGPRTAAQDEEARVTAESQFAPLRHLASQQLDSMGPVIRQNLRGVLQSGDPGTVADSLNKVATTLAQKGDNKLQPLIDYYKNLAKFAQQDPDNYKVFADSVLLPMFDSIH